MNPLSSILAIETATKRCSVALSINGVLFYREQEGDNIHSQCLLTMVEEVLQESQYRVSALDAIVVNNGPGSFTGLRVGVGVAQGIAYAQKIPMYAVDTLSILAEQVDTNAMILSAIDARMQEVYWCIFEYKQQQLQRLTPLKVGAVQDIVVPHADKKWVCVGNAWVVYCEDLPESIRCFSVLGDTLPNAQYLLQYAQKYCTEKHAIAAQDFTLEYVRNNIANKTQPVRFIFQQDT